MFLKRSIVLMAGLAVFIIGFIVYFHIEDNRVEETFRQERAKFGVENQVLTDSGKPLPTPAEAVPATPSPAANSNSLIGPVPPSGNNSGEYDAPVTHPSFFVTTAYRPFAQAQVTNPVTAPAPATPVTPPVGPASTEVSATALSTTSTNAPATNVEAGAPVAKPVPVGASIIVLGYHQFTGPGQGSKNVYSMRQEVFAEEMKYLHDNGYHVVPLSDVIRFLRHEIGLQPNTVAITIDDGYKSPILWAAPILKQYGYPWTFFVYPDFITVNEGKGAASWNDLKALQADGVDIECHSKSHPILTKRGGKSAEQYDAWLTAETAGAKATIEQHLGTPVKYFAYPYGAYNKQVEAKAIAAGYEGIFTVADNPVHASTNPNCIGRYIITTPVEKNFAAYLRQGALSVAEASPAPGATISQARPVITAVLGYVGTLEPKSIEAEVRDFGRVPCDYDPKTSTVRLYLQRDLIQPVVTVNIRARDAASGQMLVANWHFNFEPSGSAEKTGAAKPIGAQPTPLSQGISTNVTMTPVPAATSPTNSAPTTPATNAPTVPSPTNLPSAPVK